MKNIIRTIEEVTKTFFSCDFCKDTRNVKQCFICGKDICFNCGVSIDESNIFDISPSYSSDYPKRVCNNCWDNGEKFRQEVTEKREALERLELDTLTKWRKKMVKQ